MSYNKKEHLLFLMHPYRSDEHKFPRSEKIRLLKQYILRINRRAFRKGDFIQSKSGFKSKVRSQVKVPKTYIFTKRPADIKPIISELDEFVFKPNHLSRGIGVRVLKNLGNGNYQDLNGDILTTKDLIDEANVLTHVKGRGTSKIIRGIMIEERIYSNDAFKKFTDTDGIVDIRFVFWKKEFIFGIVRFPTEKSDGYGNIGRGAKWGVLLANGEFTNDDRFNERDVLVGKLPFFVELLETSKKVLSFYRFPFQSVDMTVDRDGNVVVVESERSPQIEAYFTPKGDDWIDKIVRG